MRRRLMCTALAVITGALGMAAPGAGASGTTVRPAAVTAPVAVIRPAAAATTIYVVRRGDSLSRIARITHTPLRTLLALNHLRLTSVIRPGRRLVVLAAGNPTAAPPPAPAGDGLVRRAPLASGVRFSWSTTHSGYPAADIFAACRSVAVAPVTGTVIEVRTENLYNPTIDNPAYRGGRYVAILGDDGVRYYMAHFDEIMAGTVVGARVTVGTPIAYVGKSGRAGSCHIHFGLSLPCPGKEWRVRRGVIWPQAYLSAWRSGTSTSPRAALDRWSAANPTACAVAMALPTAPDA